MSGNDDEFDFVEEEEQGQGVILPDEPKSKKEEAVKAIHDNNKEEEIEHKENCVYGNEPIQEKEVISDDTTKKLGSISNKEEVISTSDNKNAEELTEDDMKKKPEAIDDTIEEHKEEDIKPGKTEDEGNGYMDAINEKPNAEEIEKELNEENKKEENECIESRERVDAKNEINEEGLNKEGSNTEPIKKEDSLALKPEILKVEEVTNIEQEDDGFDFVEEKQSQPQPTNADQENVKNCSTENKSNDEKEALSNNVIQKQISSNKSNNDNEDDLGFADDEGESKPKSQSNKSNEEGKKGEDKGNENDDFDFVEEDNQPKEQDQNESPQDKDKDKGSDSEDSIESEEDNLPRLKEDQPTSKADNDTKEKAKEEQEDDDVFDFVEEDNNAVGNNKPQQELPKENTTNVKEDNQSNDDFDFVEEEQTESSKEPPSTSTEDKTKLQPSIDANRLNPIPFGKHKEKISLLLSNYQQKYSLHSSVKVKEDEGKSFDYKSSSHISDLYLNSISTTYSIKSLYESVSQFRQSSQIEIKPFTLDQLYSIYKSKKPVTQNIFNQSNAFIANVNSQSKEFYQHLFIKFNDLAQFYKNSVNPHIEIINQKEKKTPDPIAKLVDHQSTQINKEASLLNIGEHFISNDKKNKAIEAPVGEKADSEEAVHDEEEMAEERPKQSNATIEINQDLFELLSGINTNPTPPNQKEEETKKPEFNEDQMMKMLLSIGVKEENLIKKPEVEEKSKEKIEEERNDQKIKDFISKLPNYSFLTSKYVEYPDSLFN